MILHRFAFAALTVAILFLLAACQTQPMSTQQQQLISQIPTWRAEGKIAINRGSHSHSASFDWRQQDGNYAIHLFGPLGQGATWLRRSPQGVTLENAEIGLRRASSPEQLMSDHLGWQVPINNMQYWLRGLSAPKPAPKHRAVDPQGLLTALDQQGWRVTYNRYQAHKGWLMPAKITAQREGMTVIVVIKRWQLSLAPTPVAH